MQRRFVRYSLPAVTMSAIAALQGTGAVPRAHAAVPGAARSQTFKGAAQDTRHGPIQVSIVVKSKKIVNVKAAISPADDGRSPFLQRRAVLVLKQEVLAAQSSQVDTVSGATETSDAYIQSLQSAIKKARKAKALVG